MKTPLIMFRLRLVLPATILAIFIISNVPCTAQTTSDSQRHNPQVEVHRTKAFVRLQKRDLNGAITEFQTCYAFDRISDLDAAANDLNIIGLCHMSLKLYDTAIQDFTRARPLFRKVKDANGEASNLSNLGLAYESLNHSDKAIWYNKHALALFQKIKDRAEEAKSLDSLGRDYEQLSQYEKARSYFQQTLSLFPQIKDPDGEASSLSSLGNICLSLSQYDQAVQYFQKALPIYQQIQDHSGEAKTFGNLGLAYKDLSQFDTAIHYYEKALTFHQQVKDSDEEASDLNSLGIAYAELSQYGKAMQYFQNALSIFQQIKDRGGEAIDLGSLGNTYLYLHQYHKALPYFQSALSIHQQVQDRDGEAGDLNNMGNAYDDLGQHDLAIQNYHKAIVIHQHVGDRDGEARDFSNLGNAYLHLNQNTSAIRSYQQALPILQEVKDREGEAIDLNNLMNVLDHQGNSRLAIFYGKQSVNVLQSIRQDIHSMDKETQQTYLKDKEPTYRQLAELLIKQGRLAEAEQVLNLLKNQEFFDFVQRDAANAPEAGQAVLTPVEEEWQKRYEIIADKVTSIGQTKIDLLAKQQQADNGQITLTASQKADLQQHLIQADADLTVANKAFQDFLTQIAMEAQDAPKTAQDRVQTVTDATAFEDTLSQLGPGTVALYTIVETDKVRILVVTSQTQIAREYPIKDTDLRAKVLAFRQVLQDPTRDPRPLAHELYTILVGPIEKDLQGAQATTLMWSLDDVLRYLPMAALYDGKQYLVERYRNDVFTPASESRLTETPQATWNGLGLGVSLPHPGFLALTGVPQELDGVIHDPNVTASQTGALPGTILLDTAFTQQAMTQALEAHKYPLVHIASHFDFEPGNETASFLLLGDGSHLSLTDIKTLPQVFQGVDLLTLSACDTADGSTGADGHEVEGFAVLAQRQGAKAVIASLWPVADASTPLLMQTFYRQHATRPDQSKAESLRLAQLSLLQGAVSASGSDSQRAQIVPDKKNQPITTAPPFTPDPKAPFAHPYYWAPFILIGNWR